MPEGLPVVRVVPLAVAPLLAEPLGDADLVVGGDADVALVEEGMELLRQQQAVLDVVACRTQVRLDVSGVENRLGVLGGYGALAVVGTKQAEPERALTLPLYVLTEHELPFVHVDQLEP